LSKDKNKICHHRANFVEQNKYIEKSVMTITPKDNKPNYIIELELPVVLSTTSISKNSDTQGSNCGC
jgi:N-methylhydantoinase B/oxoprolinase/acetone carboxylase alpha subunit